MITISVVTILIVLLFTTEAKNKRDKVLMGNTNQNNGL